MGNEGGDGDRQVKQDLRWEREPVGEELTRGLETCREMCKPNGVGRLVWR